MKHSSKLLAEVERYDDVQQSTLKQVLGPRLADLLGPGRVSLENKISQREAYPKDASPHGVADLRKALLQLLTDQDFDIAIAAAWEFHWHPELASPKLQDQLLALLSGPLPTARAAAALVFGQLGQSMQSEEVEQSLLCLLRKDDHEVVRAAAARSLGLMGSDNPSVLDALLDALLDPSPLVRGLVVRSLGELCSEGSRSDVIERLSSIMIRDPSKKVRAVADEVCADLFARISGDEPYESTIALPTYGKPPVPPSGNGADSASDPRLEVHSGGVLVWNHKSLENAYLKLVLRRLKNLVRIGTRVPSTAEKWQQLVSGALQTLKPLKETRVRKSPVDLLDLAVLEAEFEDRCGRYESAVRVLEDAIPALLTASVEALLGAEAPSLEELPAFRLKIWVVMTYAWVRYYRLGEYAAAKRHLDQVATRIHALRNEDNPWFGTFSRLKYYIGHCLRGMRDFNSAEICFTEAALLADKRRAFRLAQGGGKRAFEDLWAMVTTARAQGAGLGWSLLQRGRLSEAKRHLLFAQNALNTTGEEFTKLFNRSLVLIADRRSTATSDPHYRPTLAALQECVREYERLKDANGQLRCFHELCLGFLDLCEFQGDMACRGEAERVLERIASLRNLTQDRRWHMKYDLLRVRYELTPLGEIPGKCEGIAEERFHELVQTIGAYLSRDPSNGKLLIMRGLLLWVEGRHSEACKRFRSASQSAGPGDPVLRREALLLFAWCIATEIVVAVKNAGDLSLEAVQGRLDQGTVAFEEAGHNFGDLRVAETENAYLKDLTERTERVTIHAKNGLCELQQRLLNKDPEFRGGRGQPTHASFNDTDETSRRLGKIRGVRT